LRQLVVVDYTLPTSPVDQEKERIKTGQLCLASVSTEELAVEVRIREGFRHVEWRAACRGMAGKLLLPP